MVFVWNIAPDGTVEGLSLVNQTTAPAPLVQCVEKVLNETRFPVSADGATGITYPLMF